ncbi:MAG: threonyl-tRNA synthetase editing domain-containing protein, partial [Nanoarchaeota archaeon]
MKILAIHSDFITVEPKAKAIKDAESIDKAKLEMKECLVVFSAVEKNDEANPGNVAKRLAKEVEDILNQVKSRKVMLYPYVHLTSNPSSPGTALKVLKDAESMLLKNKLDVMRAPFGWYKAFTISCKGHPLSELSREFGPEDVEGEKRHEKGVDKPFEMSEKQLSPAEKVTYSTALIIGKAVKDLFPEAELGSIGFYQDQAFVDISKIKLSNEDFDKIGKQVNKIIGKGVSIEKVAEPKDKLQKEIKKDLGKPAEAYKVEDVIVVPLYKGPFVESSKKVSAFKIVNLASAYWKNNSNNEQLVRLYAVGFNSDKGLKEYNERQAEAERRDHRKLGLQLGLFSIHEEAPGMPFFHNKGTFIFNKLVEFMTSEMNKLNYEINKTPIILNKGLWLQSGHWDHYKDNMYFTKIDNEDYAVKPMNCPGNILVFKSKLHSYRELPIKAGEFGLVHRHELSGALSGLFRVRVFTQDDAHVFCTEEQMQEQIIELIDLIGRVYSTFGFEYKVELSTKPA